MSAPIESPLRTPVILVVDDEARILSALQRTLRREGYEILVAETVDEAFRILAERDIDILMSDHKMPGMTGVQFLEQAAIHSPASRRMIITGWTEEIPEDELRRIGVCALITKPWEDAKLKATLRRALG